MKKLFLCILAMMCLTAGLAEARLSFEDQFSLTLPEDWVSYALDPALVQDGYQYCLGSADGTQLMYIQRWPTNCATLGDLHDMLDARDEIALHTDHTEGKFVMYTFANQDASGGATLLGGDILNIIFLPQSDQEHMLVAATVIESYVGEVGGADSQLLPR